MAEEKQFHTVDDVKRDIQASIEQGFPQFIPLSIRYETIDPQDNGTFNVRFAVITHEAINAGFTGVVGYDESGQFSTRHLFRYD